MFRFFLLLLLSSSVFAESFPEHPDDNRSVRSSSSPDWLAAVGYLNQRFPAGTDIYKPNSTGLACTISLVNFLLEDSKAGITAAHCVFELVVDDHIKQTNGGYFKGWSYVSMNPTIEQKITFTTKTGKKIVRKIVKVHHFGNDPLRDVAVVEFDKSISIEDIEPLIVRTDKGRLFWIRDLRTHTWTGGTRLAKLPDDHEDKWEERIDPLYRAYWGVAGHSADSGRGQNGKVLTYNYPCKAKFSITISGQYKWWPNDDGETCFTYAGASGGPVVVKAKLAEPWCMVETADDVEVVRMSELNGRYCDPVDELGWNDVFLPKHNRDGGRLGGSVGKLPYDRPLVFHVGNITGGDDPCAGPGRIDLCRDYGEDTSKEEELKAITTGAGSTYWYPNNRKQKEYEDVRDALADIYFRRTNSR